MNTGANSSHWWLENLSPHVLTFLSLAIVFLIFSIRKWRTTPTRDWAIVEGSVQHAKMIVGGGRDVGKYAVIAYSYFVNEYRSGEYTRTFVREDSALKFANAMRDKKVQVHYNPRDPDLSNLKDDEVDRLLLETDEAKVS